MTTRVFTALGLLLLAGCASDPILTELPTTHPASPGGVVATLSPASDTLSVAAADPVSPGGAANPVADHSGHAMTHGDGHGAHPEAAANAEAPGAPADATAQLYVCPMHKDVTANDPSDRCPKCKMKVNKPVRAAGGEKQAAGSAQLYMCPMHKDVTATNPNDRCPKCKMKINKPVKAPASAQAKEDAPVTGDEHAGHEGHSAQGGK